MKIFKLTCGAEVLLDDEDYEKIPKTGWYLSPISRGSQDGIRKTRYAKHDTYGAMHRYILGVTDPSFLVDHIDRNGLNNQKENLRIVTSGENKKNQSVTKNNKFNFSGISFEKGSNPRVRVRWSEGPVEWKYNGFRAKQHSKGFNLKKYNYNYNLLLKDAVLFRIQKMKENGYLLDERSTTIEKILLENQEPNMEEILEINFKEIFE